MKPLEVKLPVCPRCNLIGAALADGRKGTKFSCVGPTKNQHKRTTMELRLFREVLPEREEQQ